MPEFRVVHTNAVFFTLPGPLQLWGRSGKSVPQTADIALLCNEIKSKVPSLEPAARAYAHSEYEHIGLSFIREAPTYRGRLAESSICVNSDRASFKSSVGIC